MSQYLAYEFDIDVDGSDFELNPSEFGITLRDSIHEFYSKANLEVQDVTGVMNEYGLFLNGTSVEVLFGREQDENNSNSYVVNTAPIVEMTHPGLVAGTIDVNLIHQFASVQSVESAAHEGENSEFVEDLLEDGEFEEVRIQPTAWSRIWYRPQLTQRQTIQLLCEKAYSPDAERTPYFCFIDSRNIFHYESYEAMMNTSSLKELLVRPEDSESHTGRAVYEIYPIPPRFTDKPWRHRQYWITNEGKIEKKERGLDEVGSQPGQSPLIVDEDLISTYHYEWQKKTEEQREAKFAKSLKDSLFLQRYVVYAPLDTRMVAGRTIDLSITHYSENGRETSPASSGKYLIEASEHRWDGPEQSSYSKLLLTRNRNEYPASYLVGDRTYGS